MRFTVDEPEPGLAAMIEDGPQAICHAGDEMCAFYPGGPCTAEPCTCETTGHCLSCRPRTGALPPHALAQDRPGLGVNRVPTNPSSSKTDASVSGSMLHGGPIKGHGSPGLVGTSPRTGAASSDQRTPRANRSGPGIPCAVGGCFREAHWEVVAVGAKHFLQVCADCRDELLAMPGYMLP